MIHIIYSPEWFYAEDLIIDSISVLVLLLIAIFSIKSYKIKENKNYVFLALSFFLIAVAFIFKIMMNFGVYYDVIETQKIGAMTLHFNEVEVSNILFIIGYLTYRLLSIIGLYLLYSIYNKQSWKNHILFLYLIIISVYFTQSTYYMFHLTFFVILTLISISYWKSNVTNSRSQTKVLGTSFIVIALSQMISMFAQFDQRFYVASEIIQLLGYIGILCAFVMVLFYGRKKNKN